jgi:sugar O-acyltransferase (sialic acid O-acetyltransferase NeuD family)
MMRAIIVLGSGGHAAEVCAYVGQLAEQSGTAELLGCLDDYGAAAFAGEPAPLGGIQHLAQLMQVHEHLHAITATGDNVLRRLLVARAEAVGAGPVTWWTLVHPHASVGSNVEIGAGTCLAPGSIVTTRSRIGRHCILNVKASVSHDVTIGDYVNVNPGVVIAGGARIGDGCYIGAGATVIDRVKIGQGAVVGAGAVVVEDLPANATAVGVPARVIKYHTGTWEPALVARRA